MAYGISDTQDTALGRGRSVGIAGEADGEDLRVLTLRLSGLSVSLGCPAESVCALLGAGVE
jgi:hypothetical protein